MQIQDFYSGSTQPDLHPFSSNFNPKLEVPLIQNFQIKPSSNIIDYVFNQLSQTFGLKHHL